MGMQQKNTNITKTMTKKIIKIQQMWYRSLMVDEAGRSKRASSYASNELNRTRDLDAVVEVLAFRLLVDRHVDSSQ